MITVEHRVEVFIS